MRYECLSKLLSSIQQFYPKMRVIIADDSPPEEYKEIDSDQYPYAFQYRMPSLTGWFAGRALAISQVTTDYFLWVDDDFVFTQETDLLFLLSAIEDNGEKTTKQTKENKKKYFRNFLAIKFF